MRSVAYRDPSERGLARYVERIATALGVGPQATWCGLTAPAGAYIALEGTLPDHPGHDTALVWDTRHGWAHGIDTGRGDDLLIVAYLGGHVLPEPDAVVTFTKTLQAGQPAGHNAPPALPALPDLATRLADYDHPDLP